MKKIVLGILAHVDSGKTTLSESMLFSSGQIKRLGRVDHGDAFLDTDKIERERGITIFSKQAFFSFNGAKVTLIDTPGHTDFSAEAERSLGVLDYAVLVISATDGVQSHTRTLWNFLSHYGVPTFIFVNKMDICHRSKEEILDDLSSNLNDMCISFEEKNDGFFEALSFASDELMNEYIENGKISDTSISDAIKQRAVFPCFFGSALKNEGTINLLNGITTYTKDTVYPSSFSAKVFKISEDDKGNRLTHIKITGGELCVKDVISIKGKEEKVNEIRLYSGEKYTSSQKVQSGDICAITGITSAFCGDTIGEGETESTYLSEPVFNYSVVLPEGTNFSEALGFFRKLEQEDTQMKVSLSGNPQKINVRIMGEIQLEVLKRILADRFSLCVEFEQGTIVYKETPLSLVEGVGHYEPLRHYSEVHLLIEPDKRGSGLSFFSKCSEDVLSRNWQRLILSHLGEKTHLGTLTGSALTDAKITLVSGRADKNHTDGGDFRQATYRAVRQGLMQAKMALLEPYYSFILEIPTSSTGRALTDLDNMGATFSSPEPKGDITLIKGKAPVSAIMDYHKSVISYTKGNGRLSLQFSGYDICQNQEEIVQSIGYDPCADLENSPDSVFCSHGAALSVKWDEVFDYMHLPLLNTEPKDTIAQKEVKQINNREYTDAQLLEIFERTYGKVREQKPKSRNDERTAKQHNSTYKSKHIAYGPEYLLVDGYNIIHAWDELKSVFYDSPDTARHLLTKRLCNYAAMKQNNIILVFDAYKVKGSIREIEKVNNITIVYTKEAETADTYIEKTSKELAKNYRVRVATSDSLEQLIIFGSGALRVSAEEFYKELTDAERKMRELIT